MNDNNQNYDILQEGHLNSNEMELKRMRRSLVGTISIDEHRSLPVAGWLSHFAIKPKFHFEKAAEAIINRALKHGMDSNFNTVEMATTECQFQLRELLLKLGFTMKQIYHRQILGSNNFRIMKSQMGIDLMTSHVSKNK